MVEFGTWTPYKFNYLTQKWQKKRSPTTVGISVNGHAVIPGYQDNIPKVWKEDDQKWESLEKPRVIVFGKADCLIKVDRQKNKAFHSLKNANINECLLKQQCSKSMKDCAVLNPLQKQLDEVR